MTDVSDGDITTPKQKRPNPVTTWFFAVRPDSFVAASMPVVTSLALAWRDCNYGRSGKFLLVPAICCLFFAVLGQAAANLFNDYSDYRTGANSDLREAKEKDGWINRRTLLTGALAALFASVLFGLATIPYGGATIVYAGLIFSAIGVLYSVGPFPFSERGLGDLAVFATFGVGSVVFTYFLQTKSFSWDALALGVVFGLAINNILVANNYADYEQDRAVQKYTTVVLFGERFGRQLYLVSGIIAVFVLGTFYTVRQYWGVFAVLSLVVYGLSVYRSFLTHCRTDYVKQTGLAQAGISVVILGVLIPLAILL